MPKGLNLKGFGRRKSSGNALDIEQPERESVAPPAQSSFRVLERPDSKKSASYGHQKPTNSGRAFNSPLNALRGKSVDNLTLGTNRSVDPTTRSQRMGWPLNGTRGSGGTTNSGSSGYYESSSASAKHSSTSTLPSSVDQEQRAADDEELFPHPPKSLTTGMYQKLNAPHSEPPLPPPPKFSTRAARAFSFGVNKHAKTPSKDIPLLPPPHNSGVSIPAAAPRSHSPCRERAMTTSSYASTAVPTQTELKLSSPDFGDDDFGNMFESLKKGPAPSPPPQPPVHRTVSGSTTGAQGNAYVRQESEPMYPPRTLSRNAFTPSPNPPKPSRADSSSPYSWDDGSSNDGLVSSSARRSPSLSHGGMPGTAVGAGIAQAFLGKSSQSGYARVPERYNSPGLGRESIEDFSGGFLAADVVKEKELAYTSRQAQVDDEDRWTRTVELRDGAQGRSLSSSASNSKLSTSTNATARQPQQALAGASRNGATSPHSSLGEDNTTTPRAARKLNALNEDSMFDVSPAGPASRASRPDLHQRTESGNPKTMTKAQYQAMMRQGGQSAEQSEEEDLSDEDYDEDDEVEHARKLATQRRKQEANMSVYRQQMKKVTGGGPTNLPSSAASTARPTPERGSTAPAGIGLHFGGFGAQPPEVTVRGRQDDDEDEDIPLGILQAHNFPNSGRPPTGLGENDLHQRQTSTAGSVMNGGAGQGNLPPFARRLPQDPYFGAGLVNPSTRESLALNNPTASIYGAPPGASQLMVPGMPGTPGGGHPGGLVGVIAGEEKAKAARRGSPNAAAMMGGAMPGQLPSNMAQPPSMQRAMSMGNMMPPTVYSPSGMPLMSPMPQQFNPMMMGGMPGVMPQMPQDANQQQMQQFMAMQMQLMQNMINMQQAQMGGQMTPSATMQPQQQDYLGVNFNNANRPMSMASQQGFAPPNQGRSMTMTNPPSGWGSAANPSGPRPNSAMPGYAPSMNGLNMSQTGAGAGYTPSIAPSERSNIGMPSRYRPVTQNGEPSRSQSMTSSHTLQQFASQQNAPNIPGTPFGANTVRAPKSTIRVVEKPRGAPKVSSKAADKDEDEGWEDMKKKREEKKKSKWSFRKDKTTTNEPALSELYQTMD